MGNQKALPLLGAVLTLLLIAGGAFGPLSWAGQSGSSRRRPPIPTAPYAAADIAAFTARFQTEIWPLLTDRAGNCAGCHRVSNPSQMHLVGSTDDVFKTLLNEGHFDPENPASLLARVTAPLGPTRMPPPPLDPWSEQSITTLRSFVNDLYTKRQRGQRATDELFPAELMTPYTGKKASPAADNTFLTYYQLHGKIKTIFQEDWKREGRDLFVENMAQFGGADFIRSFNESARPTAQFLSGVDILSRDMATRAYLASTGPFTGRAENLPSPLGMSVPDAVYKREINRLYQRVLFRNATTTEMLGSFQFLQGVCRAQKDLAEQSYDLQFELSVKDEHGLDTTQNFSIQVVNDRYGLCQTLVNQNENGDSDGKPVVQCKLNGPFTFKANDPEQKVVISNVGTHGNVIVHGIEVRGPLPDGPSRKIVVTDPAVQAQGGWRLTQQNGIPCYEDENQNKGASSLILPVHVTQEGQYEITLDWRSSTGSGAPQKGRRNYSGLNADNVLVEVLSQDKSKLASPSVRPVPPKGEAHFSLDQSDDTVSFRDLNTLFQFGAGDGVEISNANTRQRVVADAVKFIPQPVSDIKTVSSSPAPFLVRAKDAEGQTQWKDYQKGQYTFYRPIGPRVVSDENEIAQKGKLRLFYRPDSQISEWRPDSYYHVAIGYPGELKNDTAVPIVVRAKASSPIVRLSYPIHAHAGAVVTLDATGSYNLQGTPLQYTWRQVGGSYVPLSRSHAPTLTFIAPALSGQQAAWEGLCRALMKHPDFLFTRPLSLATVKEPQTRKRLQLVKIAQDLVGRPPTAAELAKLEKGASLARMIEDYLGSPEFKEFYFRRIRLYLESHGTEEEDEPVRLWSWIAFNDRPFKEILTADYTVGADWQKMPRPAYCGKSGVLSMKGFIKGKPGLPHFNYAAQVCEKFLGYVFEVPAEIVKMREGITAASTTSPSSVCYSCHKVLTPLAYQRGHWTDDGEFQSKDDDGKLIDDSDRQLVPSYPFKGNGLEAFSLQAQNKERFIRTILQTHFSFYFGREMRYDRDERGLYKRLWEAEKANNYSLKGLIRTLMTSSEYLNGNPDLASPPPPKIHARK
jgi:hypothetical protein